MQSDYTLLMNNDFMGLLEKYKNYVNYFSNRLSKKFLIEYDDVKQDIITELFDMCANWIEKKKINENLKMKHFIYRRINNLQKHYQTLALQKTTYFPIEMCESHYPDIETKFIIEKDFPEKVLTKKIDREIYADKFLYKMKTGDIKDKYKISHEWLNRKLNLIKNEYKKYALN